MSFMKSVFGKPPVPSPEPPPPSPRLAKDLEAYEKAVAAMNSGKVLFPNNKPMYDSLTGIPSIVHAGPPGVVTCVNQHQHGLMSNMHVYSKTPAERLHIVAMGRVQEHLLRNGIDFRVPVKTNVTHDSNRRCYEFAITTMTGRPLTSGVLIPADVVEEGNWDSVDFVSVIETLVAGMLLTWEKYGEKYGDS